MPETKQGTIEKIVADKGYGFIRSGPLSYFFHSSECQSNFDDLIYGDEVEFTKAMSEKGPRATDVAKIKK